MSIYLGITRLLKTREQLKNRLYMQGAQFILFLNIAGRGDGLLYQAAPVLSLANVTTVTLTILTTNPAELVDCVAVIGLQLEMTCLKSKMVQSFASRTNLKMY